MDGDKRGMLARNGLIVGMRKKSTIISTALRNLRVKMPPTLNTWRKLLHWYKWSHKRNIYFWNEIKLIPFSLYRINFLSVFFFIKINIKNSFKARIRISGFSHSKVPIESGDGNSRIIDSRRVLYRRECSFRQVDPPPSTLFSSFIRPPYYDQQCYANVISATSLSRARLASVDSRSISFFRGVSTTRAARRH